MGGRSGKVVEKHPDGVTVRWAGGTYEKIPIASKVESEDSLELAGEYHWAMEGSRPASGSKPGAEPGPAKEPHSGATPKAPPKPSSAPRSPGEKPKFWKSGEGMANEDESEVEISPSTPMSNAERVIKEILSHVRRNKQDTPQNTGLALEYEKHYDPTDKEEGGFLVNARQPDRYVRSGPSAPRTVDPNAPKLYEAVGPEYPGLIRKVSGKNIGRLYIQAIAHPGMPKERSEHYHGHTNRRLTPEEEHILKAHFLKTKTPGVELTGPRVNAAGKPIKSVEQYPQGVHYVSSGFYRVGYDPENVADEEGYRKIPIENITRAALVGGKHTSGKEPIQWVDVKPSQVPEIGTSNKRNSGAKNMKQFYHQRLRKLSQLLEQDLHNQGEGMSNEDIALGGNRRRAWRNYSYRKLGLPKLGFDNDTGRIWPDEGAAVPKPGSISIREAVTEAMKPKGTLPPPPHETGPSSTLWEILNRNRKIQTANEDTDEHEELKKQFLPHSLADAALDQPDYATSLKMLQKAGELAGEAAEVGLSSTSPAEPKAPTAPSSGKTGGSAVDKLGSAVGKQGLQYGAAKAKNAGAALGINLSNTPSSHRITRSPGNQILFELRQKKGR